MNRVFGLRLFFLPRGRERLGRLLVVLGALFYLARAVVQLTRLRAEIANADFPFFHQAAVDLAAGRDPYTPFLSRCPGFHWCFGGYIYPPLLAELLRPLTGLDVVGAEAIWIIASHLMLAGAAYVTYLAIGADLPRGAGRILLAASLFFLPVYQNLYSASVGALLLLVLALAAWAYVAGRAAGAGVSLGVGAVLRVTPVAMGPMLLRTRADFRRPAGAVAMAVTGILLMAFLTVLTPYTFEYLTAVLPRISAGTDFVSNVSLPAVLLRLQEFFLAGQTPGGNLLGTVLTIALVGLTWWYARGLEGRAARAASFAGFLAVTALASSVTWNYHLTNELLVLALLAPWLSHGRHAVGLVGLSYPLLWIYSDGVLAATRLKPGGPVVAVVYIVVTSLNAVGMLLLWLACLDVLHGLRQESGTS